MCLGPISRRPTHCACYHRRSSLPGGCCICLEQFARDSTFIAVTTSFPQKTEDWTFCPVLQLFCLMSVSLYWLLCDPTLLLRVLTVLGLYATSSQFVIIIIIIIIILKTVGETSKVTIQSLWIGSCISLRIPVNSNFCSRMQLLATINTLHMTDRPKTDGHHITYKKGYYSWILTMQLTYCDARQRHIVENIVVLFRATRAKGRRRLFTVLGRRSMAVDIPCLAWRPTRRWPVPRCGGRTDGCWWHLGRMRSVWIKRSVSWARAR